MLWRREYWKTHDFDNHIISLSYDSSEKGKDLLLIQEFTINLPSALEKYLDDLKQAVAAENPDSNSDSDDEDEPFGQFGQKVLQPIVWERVLPPMTLGKGYTKVSHKLDALIFAFLLEIGNPNDLASYNSRVVSTCTDQGTEFYVAGAPAVDVEEMQRETAALLNIPFAEQHQIEDKAYVMQIEDVFVVGPSRNAPPAVDAVAAPAAEPTHVEEQEVDAAQENLQRIARLYPNSFQTADLKHVVDNALSEVLGTMNALCLAVNSIYNIV